MPSNKNNFNQSIEPTEFLDIAEGYYRLAKQLQYSTAIDGISDSSLNKPSWYLIGVCQYVIPYLYAISLELLLKGLLYMKQAEDAKTIHKKLFLISSENQDPSKESIQEIGIIHVKKNKNNFSIFWLKSTGEKLKCFVEKDTSLFNLLNRIDNECFNNKAYYLLYPFQLGDMLINYPPDYNITVDNLRINNPIGIQTCTPKESYKIHILIGNQQKNDIIQIIANKNENSALLQALCELPDFYVRNECCGLDRRDEKIKQLIHEIGIIITNPMGVAPTLKGLSKDDIDKLYGEIINKLNESGSIDQSLYLFYKNEDNFFSHDITNLHDMAHKYLGPFRLQERFPDNYISACEMIIPKYGRYPIAKNNKESLSTYKLNRSKALVQFSILNCDEIYYEIFEDPEKLKKHITEAKQSCQILVYRNKESNKVIRATAYLSLSANSKHEIPILEKSDLDLCEKVLKLTDKNKFKRGNAKRCEGKFCHRS